MKYWSLRLAVFICGASVMIIEVVGSRLLAPYLGGSLIVWTTLIGIILAALSIGYWLGGKIADRGATVQKFGLLILISALLVGVIIWLNGFIRPLAMTLVPALGLEIATIIISVIIFALPAIIFGMISPYALRLALKDVATAGQVAGSLYALSTIGSIVGTFAAGFVLIPALGSFKTLVCISILVALTSLLFVRRQTSWLLIALLAVSGLSVFNYPQRFYAYPHALADIESAYSRIFIIPWIDRATDRPTINLMTGPHLAQSGRFTDSDNDLLYEYTKFFRNAERIKPDIQSALMIGGGAYSVPSDFLKRHPEATIDVVEIDPLYTELARRYFNLRDNDRLRIYHEDARIFLNTHANTYDVIYVDAFTSMGSAPFQLTTAEAVAEIKNNLSNDGIVMVNLIGSVVGPGSEFIKAEYATYTSLFESVKLFPLGGPADAVQNIILIARQKDEWPAGAAFLDGELKNFKAATRILTDDWSPVDYFLAGAL